MIQKAFIIFFSFFTCKSISQTNNRLDIITDTYIYHTLYNKLPNRVNYYPIQPQKKCNCNCKLLSYDSVIIKKISNYEYTIRPNFEDMPYDIAIFEVCNNRITDTFYFELIETPKIWMQENTDKQYTVENNYDKKNDGILDTLNFFIRFGVNRPDAYKIHKLNLKHAKISLLDISQNVIDSFILRSNILNNEYKKRMKNIYLNKELNFYSIKVDDIILTDLEGFIYKPKYFFSLPSKAIVSIE